MILLICLMSFVSKAQSDSLPGDPGMILSYNVQNMSFGTFSNRSTGGTVNISASGVRSFTDNVILINQGSQFFPAIVDIDVLSGSIISILKGPDVILTGSNGGSMSMHIDGTSPASPFITTAAQPARTRVSIGGTLTIGSFAANPPGIYSGTFYLTFNVE